MCPGNVWNSVIGCANASLGEHELRVRKEVTAAVQPVITKGSVSAVYKQRELLIRSIGGLS